MHNENNGENEIANNENINNNEMKYQCRNIGENRKAKYGQQ
jgi:hypothetical protein